MTEAELRANGEPAQVRETTEGYGTKYFTLEHAETGEELGTVEQNDMPEGF